MNDSSKNLDLSHLTTWPEGLKLPESIGCGLYLSSLTAIPEGLKLPEKVIIYR